MTPTFLNLPAGKRNEILNACIAEFAEAGYENASTNRIVKSLGISKGSLFKYFPTKEDMYFYVVDYALGKFYSDLKDSFASLPPDWFERIRRIVELYIDFYACNPATFRLIMTLQDQSSFWVQDKVLERMSVIARDIIFRMFENTDVSKLSVDIDDAIQIFKWLIAGMNAEILYDRSGKADMKTIEQIYLAGLDAALDILKYGCYKQGSGV